MITELTQAQKDALPKYVKRGIEVGTNTDRFDFDTAVDIVHAVQEHLLNQDKTPVVIFDNPLEAWIACNYAANGFKANDLHKCVDEYFNGKKPSFKIETFVTPYYNGSFSSSVFAHFDVFKDELGIVFKDPNDPNNDIMKKYEIWKRTTEIGLFYNIKDVKGSVEDMAIVCQKPIRVCLNENNVIHCDGNTAVEFAGRGEIKIYALNGVVVPEWLAVTPSSKIDPKRITEISNADVKAEFVRKVGVERLLDLGKKVDSYENYNEEWWTKSEYELWDMNKLFEGVPYAPHLKMLNQTTGVWHVEAVSPSCRTIKDALKDRMGDRELNIIGIA
jgi:hypothetical protein